MKIRSLYIVFLFVVSAYSLRLDDVVPMFTFGAGGFKGDISSGPHLNLKAGPRFTFRRERFFALFEGSKVYPSIAPVIGYQVDFGKKVEQALTLGAIYTPDLFDLPLALSVGGEMLYTRSADDQFGRRISIRLSDMYMIGGFEAAHVKHTQKEWQFSLFFNFAVLMSFLF